METQCLLQLPPLDSTLGAAYIAATLYGVTNLQTYSYYERNNDTGLLRALVFILWALDTLHLVLISHTMYFYTVTNFNDPLAIIRVTWSIMAHVAVTGVSDFLVRGVFAYRVYRFSGQRTWLLATIIIPTFVVFGFSIAFTVRGWQLGTYTELWQISWVLYTAFGAGVVVDTVVAIALCILLSQRKTGIRKTDSIVRSLMLYSINTGALTSICALAVLITYATMPMNFVFIAFYFVLPKLYFNSLLATLNARERLRDTSTNTAGVVSIPLSSLEFSTRPMLSNTTSGHHNTTSLLEIEVQKTVDRRTDSLTDIRMPENSWK
ncbi:hypothetical protein BC835DRAFT_116961 [Cytidiella melzeri]|nr:hypothetical protein BC835DRAFT_116961 [Cytidiella melzeri]